MTNPSLDGCLVGDRSDALRPIALQLHSPGLPRHLRLPLQIHRSALLLRPSPLGSILLDTAQELFPAARVLHVLDADIDSLLDVAVADLLVADDADRRLGDVVDDARLAVVDLVGHAYATIRLSACASSRWVGSSPFWTAPFVTISTISPTRYVLR